MLHNGFVRNVPEDLMERACGKGGQVRDRCICAFAYFSRVRPPAQTLPPPAPAGGPDREATAINERSEATESARCR